MLYHFVCEHTFLNRSFAMCKDLLLITITKIAYIDNKAPIGFQQKKNETAFAQTLYMFRQKKIKQSRTTNKTKYKRKQNKSDLVPIRKRGKEKSNAQITS